MPKKIDPAVRERVMRMIAEHRSEYATPTELARVIAARERLGIETVRRSVVHAEVDGGIRPGASSSEHAEIKALKAQVRRLEEDNDAQAAAIIEWEIRDYAKLARLSEDGVRHLPQAPPAIATCSRERASHKPTVLRHIASAGSGTRLAAAAPALPDVRGDERLVHRPAVRTDRVRAGEGSRRALPRGMGLNQRTVSGGRHRGHTYQVDTLWNTRAL
jgi:transposase-like protein